MALPRGTVTFLFTDIEGSTQLWERDRAAMRAAVDRHLAILDTAIAAQGGVHFKTVGDALQAAFPTAPAALCAALAGQCALLAEPWDASGDAPLRVRMALHAGEAEPDDRGDYLAAPLNRLSRLLATGHGGQVLLTQAVQQLVRDALPPGAELRDLGEHQLRDLQAPERVFQLVHPALPVSFPPLVSLAPRLHHLPHQPTSFLGREREVNEVVALLQREDLQLLTLTGPGGTGKTRLALQAAAEMLDHFADGIVFVPLAPLSDPQMVPFAIARALGVREDGAQPLTERLCVFLATKRVLLLLDNFEHLVEAAPGLSALLGACPDLKILATSRQPLRLRAEREYAVPPLRVGSRKSEVGSGESDPSSEAVQLFVDRAQAVKQSFVVDAENARAIAEICWRLDGLPLAIELAAARVRLLSPQALLARLEQRLPLLTGGARDAPRRQQTLRKTIAWSYDLLSEEDKLLFQRLGVFAGGATLAAIEAVASAAGDLDVFAGLERLVAHSLVRQVDEDELEPRFQMLETIREFSLERLTESGATAATSEAHASYFQALAEAADVPISDRGQPEDLDPVEAELANIRGALEWFLTSGQAERALKMASSLLNFWFDNSHITEGRAWMERGLATETASAPAVRAAALIGIGVLASMQGDLERATAALDFAMPLAREAGESRVLAYAHAACGFLALFQRRSEEAERQSIEAIRIGTAVADLGVVFRAMMARGRALQLRGDYAQAEAIYSEALAPTRQIGSVWEGVFLGSLAMIAQYRRDYARSATLHSQMLRFYQPLSHSFADASSLDGMAIAYAERAPAAAARLFGAAAAQHKANMTNPLPMDRPGYDDAVRTAKERLGDAAFAEGWEAGTRLTLDEAITEALALAASVDFPDQTETAEANTSPVASSLSTRDRARE